MPWWKKPSGELVDDKEKPEGAVEFKPDDLKKDLESTIDNKLKTFTESITTGLKPMQEMAETVKKEREERERKEAEARRKTEAENQTDFETEFALDPAGATKKYVEQSGQKRDIALIALASRQVTADTLGTEEYYHGKVKTDTDKLIAALPPQFRCDPASIANCYKVAYMDNKKEIDEGKIKSRTSEMTSFGNNGTGAPSGGDRKEADDKLSDDEKRVATMLGLSEKDYASSRKDMSFV